MSGNFTVISNEDAALFHKLQRFYVEVCDLTLNHDVIEDNAVVYPSKLGPVLEKVDPLWYANAFKED